ncbi:12243_t:CDS:2 [Acaulospora morrowiae]|uniref:12243_t:CDS:1 n=1 Tax=Acaulospora morrowiae TaxID=94023 RepID=A0A9N8ZDI2_9GLOM|nr:12243_t:CDS:2 [Acaulospora morrowiae]
MLFERLILDDENNYISTKACGYLTLFDQIIDPSEEDTMNLNEITTKFRYLSNTLPIPVQQYDQSQFPDIHIIKSISSHLHVDAITKMNKIVENTSERSWTAHLNSKVINYRADRVAEFRKRPKQIPMFLLEVSGNPNNSDPDKFATDRKKLMNEGVFALKKFMTKTNLPTWDVYKIWRIFLAQGFDNLEIGQMIYIGPGLYLFPLFTVPNFIISTFTTGLGYAPRLIRTLLCLRYNIIKKIKKFKEFERKGQRYIMKPKTKYATGLIPGQSKVGMFAQFLSKISKQENLDDFYFPISPPALNID